MTPRNSILVCIIVFLITGLTSCHKFPSEDSSNAIVQGNLLLPFAAEGKTYRVMIDYDNDGANGCVINTTDVCGSEATVAYTIHGVPKGTYYLYAVVWVIGEVDKAPLSGDYFGYYNTGINPPDKPNAVVPSSGSVNFDITLFIIP